ncbi:MAG: GNAT family N-acetyltransferase [Lachnospiraceae bacterium]|nr:GNAT family N-acetyltransferase [Lachnospiraceae bacterium]MDE7028713.1 GNAT family N-acetyltransferase [Lachnospiraceae bacterium]
MELIHCKDEHLNMVADMYRKVVQHLEETINYPEWSMQYPCRESVRRAVEKGEQYACIEEGNVLGAFVLNDNPGGDYAAGDWSKDLAPGTFLVIHMLAVLPSAGCRGVGSYMVDCCVDMARRRGYQAVRLDVVPGNIPAQRLYQKKGFTFAGARDLLRGIPEIPLFELYELNFD